MTTRATTFAGVLALLFACAPAPRASGPERERFIRPVVAPGAPLSLANPQREAVTWPIWGSAFLLDEPVAARVVMRAGGVGEAGLVIGGERRAMALVASRGRWLLRETAAGAQVSETAIEAPAGVELTIELARGGRAVRVVGHGGARSLVLRQPLGEAAGIDVRLEPGAELSIRELALDRPAPPVAPMGTSLREAGAARGIAVGAATDIWPPRHHPALETLLAEQFGAIAPTEIYWSTTRGEDEDYFFLPADLMINFAAVHRQKVTGYFLVWDYTLPRWLEARRGDAAAVGAALDEHVATVVGRYRDRVDAWVVVNEAIWGPEDSGGEAGYARSIWLDTLGPGYIERAFRAARAADPDAVLLYNETNAEALGEKSDFVYRLAADFVARGVPLDGVGLQMHVDAADPPALDAVEANMERIGALGLSVHITELDVSVSRLEGSEASVLARQAEIYEGVLATCRKVAACRSATVFGVGDAQAWDELGENAAPLLFDEGYRPKPAFFAVQRSLW